MQRAVLQRNMNKIRHHHYQRGSRHDGGKLAPEQSREGELDATPEKGKACKTGQLPILPNLYFSPDLNFLFVLLFPDLK